ncbi:MAG: hypothetical protein BWY69_01218 [Planctomycetes bacterium ADurb.Bin401]|nr:MAG: hypothetical protein BWY69_01218 [Planctomycetes bacterium ADurb.Bin401]
MGMYGNTSHASMPPYGWALLADLNNDGTVDFIDYSFFADLYYQQGQILNADLNRNGNVNLKDLNLMALDWLAFTGWTQN